MAALGQTIGASFTSGLHVALWVSGIMLLVGAPIAFATIRYTAPHHVEARARKAAEMEVAQAAAGESAQPARASSGLAAEEAGT